MEYEHCLLQSDNSTCGVYDSTYLVTDIETQGFTNSQWCYGYADDKISKPTEPFEYYFQNCCWVDLTDDNGAEIKDGYFKLYAKFNRIDNNSPQVKEGIPFSPIIVFVNFIFPIFCYENFVGV